MIEITKHGVLLEKRGVGFECEGVINPGVIKDQTGIHLFYRAVGLGNYSTIGYCKLKNPLEIEYRNDMPILFPQYDFECNGMEDPRITKIEDEYFLTYTAYDGTNALGALAVSKDLIMFNKAGIIVPEVLFNEFIHLVQLGGSINEKYLRYNASEKQESRRDKKALLWDKNVIFFPRRIDGKLWFLHRIRPDIQIVSIETIDELNNTFWQNYFLDFKKHILLSPVHDFEVSYVGGGCPPIETKFGWLLIYHGVHDSVTGYIYSACAALLDLQYPDKEIARLPYVLFKPEFDWELKGVVNNVCFPTGAIVEDDILYIYYGAADEHVACVSLHLPKLLHELIKNKV